MRNALWATAAIVLAKPSALTVEPTNAGNLLFLRGVGNFNVVTDGDGNSAGGVAHDPDLNAADLTTPPCGTPEGLHSLQLLNMDKEQ